MGHDAHAIWTAGVDAVRADRLVRQAVATEGQTLRIADRRIDLDGVRRIVVLGAGKAGTGMVLGLEQSLGPNLLAAKQVAGWVNVPQGCERSGLRTHLHPARPMGVNEPTSEGVEGSRRILELAESCDPADLCIALWSGGGSALLPAPRPGLTLEDKLAVTRFLSAAGADIRELNTVRKHLSLLKGGRLASACKAGQIVSLVISDVIGDPLDLIASGPTFPDSSRPTDALSVLDRYGARGAVPNAVFQVLEKPEAAPPTTSSAVSHHVIGNNATAVDAAVRAAEERGYKVTFDHARTLEPDADQVGREWARRSLELCGRSVRHCWVSGGEPVVRLVPRENRGCGGRNQQLVLAALDWLGEERLGGMVLLSGGTDGEDGPTDAAGAWIDSEVAHRAKGMGLDAKPYLARNDSYSFFVQAGGLLRTGPTHTNVCDLRVVTCP
jgi:hydroxypyruvate reductase